MTEYPEFDVLLSAMPDRFSNDFIRGRAEGIPAPRRLTEYLLDKGYRRVAKSSWTLLPKTAYSDFKTFVFGKKL